MQIKFATRTTDLGSLNIGDTFMYIGALFMKCYSPRDINAVDRIPCVNLSVGTIDFYSADIQVDTANDYIIVPREDF